MELEDEMVMFMQPLFGEMAAQTIENQKDKLGIGGRKMSYEDYLTLIDSIRELCKKMAGDAIASKIYEGLKGIVDAEMK